MSEKEHIYTVARSILDGIVKDEIERFICPTLHK